MSSYDKTNTGTLGRNQRREKDTHPEYTGSLNIDGVEHWLSAWVKINQATGEKFFSLSVKPKEQRQAPPAQSYQRPQAQQQQPIRHGYGKSPPPAQQPGWVDRAREEIAAENESGDIPF
jgi:hypothetical protein